MKRKESNMGMAIPQHIVLFLFGELQYDDDGAPLVRTGVDSFEPPNAGCIRVARTYARSLRKKAEWIEAWAQAGEKADKAKVRQVKGS